MMRAYWSSIAGIFLLATAGILFSSMVSFGADGAAPIGISNPSQPKIEVGNMTQTLTVSNKPNPDKTLTTEEVATLIGVNADTVRRRAASGSLDDFVKIDRNKWRARFTRESRMN